MRRLPGQFPGLSDVKTSCWKTPKESLTFLPLSLSFVFPLPVSLIPSHVNQDLFP